jgi:hypothetical protein
MGESSFGSGRFKAVVVSGLPWWRQPGGEEFARIYYEAVHANSMAQGYGVP